MLTLDVSKGSGPMFYKPILINFWLQAPRWVRLLTIFAAGGLAGLGQAPFDIPIFMLFGLGLGIWAAGQPSTISYFGNGWALGFGYFAVALAWIMQPFLVDWQATGWMAPLALTAMAGGLAVFWGAAFAIVKGRKPLLICVALFTSELTRTYLFTGFPWALIGYVWIDTPLYQLSAFIGPHGITLLTIVMAYWLANSRLPYKIALMVLAAIMQLSPDIEITEPKNGAAVVRLIHPNVAQTDKWDPDRMKGIYQRHLEMTDTDAIVNLIVWPETSVYLPIPLAQREIAAVAHGAYVIVGYQSTSVNNKHFNTLGIISPTGDLAVEYHKSRLVPFGEYLPFSGLAALFGVQRDGFSSGEGPSTIYLPGIGNIQPLICYEGIFPQFVGRTDIRPDLLVLITNDAWFGQGQGPAQHFAQARARAIELGLPMVRVANRGVSTVIDGNGAYGANLQVEDIGFIDQNIPASLTPTFYSRYPWLLTFFMTLFLLGSAFIKCNKT